MKNTIIIIFLLKSTFIICSVNNDTTLSKKTYEFKQELKDFISKSKPHCVDSGAYAVYVANFYHSDIERKEFCFTLGYISNSVSYSYITPNYIYYLNKDIILLKINDKTEKRLIKELKLYKITKSDSINIFKKLFPSESGGITGRTRGLTYCDDNGNIHKTFYKNSDEIPLDKSIYSSFPSGVEVKLLKDDEW